MDHLKIEELAWLYQLLYLLFFYLQLLGYNVSTWKEKDRYRHTERESKDRLLLFLPDVACRRPVEQQEKDYETLISLNLSLNDCTRMDRRH